MAELFVHYAWKPFAERPLIFGYHTSEERARVECPVDMVWEDDPDPDEDGRWTLEGVAHLDRDSVFYAALKDYMELEDDLG